MRPDQLHVITAFSRPVRWESRLRLYRDFERHMLESGVQLTVVECAYGELPHELAGTPGVNHVGVHAHTAIWVKENLINIGISRLPRDWRYVAWIDADIVFRRKDWPVATLHALQHHDVVQPWSDCYDLGPNGEHMKAHKSFCYQWAHAPHGVGKSGPYTFAHPGYAWAATRHALESLGGLFDDAILGSGDHHMALALVGKGRSSCPAEIHPNYLSRVLRWQERANHHIAGNLGYVSGTIEHQWHGSKENRQYVSRWDILARHQYDPERDVKRNTSGVLELLGNKPQLRRDIGAYMRSRNEDANSL
jgi:hypothetical protein